MLLTLIFFVLSFSLGFYVYAKDFLARGDPSVSTKGVQDFSKCAEEFNDKVGEKNEGEENR